jgi:hypothetical protein
MLALAQAALQPACPPPTTMTSYFSFIPFILSDRKVNKNFANTNKEKEK